MEKKTSVWTKIGVGVFGVVSLGLLGLYIYVKSTGQL